MTAPSLPGRTDPSLSGGDFSFGGGDFSSGGTSSLLGGTPSSLSRGTLTEGELSSSASVTSSLELISQSPWPVGSQGGGSVGSADRRSTISAYVAAPGTGGAVVRKMGILEQKNCVRSSNSKIPEYARDFKNEYLFIRGINKEMESFVEKYLTNTTELFVSSYNDRIKSFIKKFMKAQELGYLNNTSCFKFKECDVENIVFLFERMHFDFEEDEEFDEGHPDDYPGYRDFYELFCKFYDKINFDSDSDSDDSVNIEDILSGYEDSETDSD